MPTSDDTNKRRHKQPLMDLEPTETSVYDTRMTFSDGDSLHGFWKGENCMPGPVRLVAGDAERFEQDIARAKGRIGARLERMSTARHFVQHSYPEELLCYEDWLNDSLEEDYSGWRD